MITYGMTNEARPGGLRAFDIRPFQTVLCDEFIPYIDTHFRTFADQPHRPMAGLSMGSMETKAITLKISTRSLTSASSAERPLHRETLRTWRHSKRNIGWFLSATAATSWAAAARVACGKAVVVSSTRAEIPDRLDKSETPLDQLAAEAKEAADLVMGMQATLRATKAELTKIFAEMDARKGGQE